MEELKKYVAKLVPNDGEKLFVDDFNYKLWRKICKKTGLAGLKFHDLRRYADIPIMPSRFIFP